MQEKSKRSIVKAFSWRFLATLTTMTLVFIFTREFTLTLEIGFFEVISKMILYYLHERGWNKISWGRSHF